MEERGRYHDVKEVGFVSTIPEKLVCNELKPTHCVVKVGLVVTCSYLYLIIKKTLLIDRWYRICGNYGYKSLDRLHLIINQKSKEHVGI